MPDAAAETNPGAPATEMIDVAISSLQDTEQIVLEGINDLGHAGTSAPASETVSARPRPLSRSSSPWASALPPSTSAESSRPKVFSFSMPSRWRSSSLPRPSLSGSRW